MNVTTRLGHRRSDRLGRDVKATTMRILDMSDQLLSHYAALRRWFYLLAAQSALTCDSVVGSSILTDRRERSYRNRNCELQFWNRCAQQSSQRIAPGSPNPKLKPASVTKRSPTFPGLASAALAAAGCRVNMTAGCVLAGTSGIRSTLAGFARLASVSGLQPSVPCATPGRRTRIGMSTDEPEYDSK